MIARGSDCARARGAVLLEIVLALGLFVAVSMTLLGVVSSAIESLSRSRDTLLAADHARNALAMIEAGIARPETLNGPVAPWDGGEDDESLGMDAGGFGGDFGSGDGAGFDDGFEGGVGAQAAGFDDEGAASTVFGEPTGWALEITTEPASVRGLTIVSVRAYRADEAGDAVEGGASVTLRQIMPLSTADSGGDSLCEDAFGGDGFDDLSTGGQP